MALFEQFPYINFHEMNLDWVLKTVKKLNITVDEFIDNYSTPMVVESASQMTSANRIYVYAGDEPQYVYGHWYYYDTESNLWVDGGEYGALTLDTELSNTSRNAVENKTITDAFEIVNESIANILSELANKKNVQSAKSSPNANGESLAFIDTISQNAQGVITATKKNLDVVPINKGGTGQTNVETISDDSIIASGDIGVATNVNFSRWGKMAQLTFVISNDEAKASGTLAFRGTVADGYRPLRQDGDVAYYSGSAIIGRLSASGNLTCMVIGDTLPANTQVAISMEYMMR